MEDEWDLEDVVPSNNRSFEEQYADELEMLDEHDDHDGKYYECTLLIALYPSQVQI